MDYFTSKEDMERHLVRLQTAMEINRSELAHTARQLTLYEMGLRLLEFYTPAEAREFLESSQKLLDGRTPADMIALGNYAQVETLIGQLEEGVYI